MKSTKFDIKILELLRENKEGLPLYNIARALNKDPGNLHRKLMKLEKNKMIIKIKSSVAIYRFDFNKPIIYYKVQCPKCRGESIADATQVTKVCPNDECLTKKGERTRFWISNNRIIDIIKV